MTIGEKIAQTVEKIIPGNQHLADGARNQPASTMASNSTGVASSNAAHGTMEQAGAGAYAGTGINSNPASGAAVGGGMAGGVTGQTTAGDMVCVPGNVAAPVTTGEKKFVVLEDHAVHKERVERWVEHQPVEREYVTKVEETGVTKAAAGYVDGTLGAERVVNEHTCFPTNTTTVHGVAGLTEAEANRKV